MGLIWSTVATTAILLTFFAQPAVAEEKEKLEEFRAAFSSSSQDKFDEEKKKSTREKKRRKNNKIVIRKGDDSDESVVERLPPRRFDNFSFPRDLPPSDFGPGAGGRNPNPGGISNNLPRRGNPSPRRAENSGENFPNDLPPGENSGQGNNPAPGRFRPNDPFPNSDSKIPNPDSIPDPFPGETPPNEGDDNGPISPVQESGEITFVLNGGVAPSYKDDKEGQAQIAALNYILNFVSKEPRLVTINKKTIKNGEIKINGFGSGRERVELDDVFDTSVIRRLLRDEVIVNPYACQGEDPNRWRVDWLASALMVPEVYYAMLKTPRNWSTLASELGVSTNPPKEASTNGNKVWAEGSMISNSATGRVLEFEGQEGNVSRIVMRSTDFERTPAPGKKGELSDPSLHPNDYEGKAGETIYDLKNGIQAYVLSDKDGILQGEAPNSIVGNDDTLVGGDFASNHGGNEISAPRDCLRCHRNGPIGHEWSVSDDFNMKQILKKQVARGLLTQQEAKDAEARYTKGKNYNAQMKQTAALFRRNLEKSGAFMDDGTGGMAPLLPDFDSEYRKPMDFAQVAKELGLEESDLEKRLLSPANESLRKRLGVDKAGEGLKKDGFKISRTIYEKIFCDLKEGLIGQPPLTNDPDFDQPPLTNEPVHSVPGTLR